MIKYIVFLIIIGGAVYAGMNWDELMGSDPVTEATNAIKDRGEDLKDDAQDKLEDLIDKVK